MRYKHTEPTYRSFEVRFMSDVDKVEVARRIRLANPDAGILELQDAFKREMQNLDAKYAR